MLTFDDFIYEAQRYRLEHPEERAGQAVHTALYYFDHELFLKFKFGKDDFTEPIDPFNDDSKIGEFLAWVKRQYQTY